MRFVGAAAIGVLIAAFLAWKFFPLVLAVAVVFEIGRRA